MLDLSAGFDVINIDILLKKLIIYNFDNQTIQWLSSYLKNRQQCVQIESSFSTFLPVHWGVPQGSILGPLIFLIYINKLPYLLEQNENHDENIDTKSNDSEVIVFTDDNTPTTSCIDPTNLENSIQVKNYM